MKSIMRIPTIAAVLLSATMLAGCATNRTPQFSYDASVPPFPAIPAAVADDRPRPLHVPPAWTVARGGTASSTPTGRVLDQKVGVRAQVDDRAADHVRQTFLIIDLKSAERVAVQSQCVGHERSEMRLARALLGGELTCPRWRVRVEC